MAAGDSQQADALATLIEIAHELSCRVGFIKEQFAASHSRPKCLDQPELDKLRKALVKAFPEPVAAAASLPGAESFSAETVLSDLGPAHELLADATAFAAEAFTHMHAFAQRHAMLRFDDAPLVVADLMELMCATAELHLLVGRLDDASAVEAMYGHALAQTGQTGQSREVAQFVYKVRGGSLGVSGPNAALRYLQSEWHVLEEPLAAAISSVQLPMLNGTNYDTLRANSVLNPLYTPANMGMPAHQPIYQHLLFTEAFERWTILGSLVCPTLLLNEAVFEMFKMGAANGFVLPIGGPRMHELLEYHTAMEELLKWFPTTKAGPFKDRKFDTKLLQRQTPKKLFEALARGACCNAGVEHRERRVYLASELRRQIIVCTECPGVMGPKAPLLLALLALGRAELRWYFAHVDQSPPPKVKAKLFASVANTYRPVGLSDLLTGVSDLSRLMLRHRTVVQRYYVAYLQGADYRDLRNQMSKIEACVQDVPAALTEMWREFASVLEPGERAVLRSGSVAEIDACMQPGAPGEVALHELRVNWKRAETAMALNSSMTAAKHMPGIKELYARMHKVVEHAQYVRSLPQLLATHAELPELNFGVMRQRTDAEFERVLLEEPEHVIAYIRLLHSMALAACDEEAEALGESAVGMATTRCQKVAQQIQALVDTIMAALVRQELEIAPVSAFRRKAASAAATRGKAPQPAEEPLPGFESKPSERTRVAQLQRASRALAALCAAVADAGEIVVFRSALRPLCFVENQLREHTIDVLRVNPVPNATAAAGAAAAAAAVPRYRPTEQLLRRRCLLYAMQRAAERLRLPLHHIVHRSLLVDTYDTRGSILGDALKAQGAGMLPGNAYIRCFTDWLAGKEGLLEHISPKETDGTIAMPGLIFSEFRGCFVAIDHDAATKAMGKSGPTRIEAAAALTTPVELSALVELTGPHGVRYLEGALLNIVGARLMTLKDLLRAQRGDLSRFQAEYAKAELNSTDEAACCNETVSLAKALPRLNDIASAVIAIGNALCMRRAVRAALRRATETDAALATVRDTVSISQHLGGITSSTDARVAAQLAWDIAAEARGVTNDSALCNIVRPILEADRSLWQLLPYACAALFTTTAWRDATYKTHVDAYSNSAGASAATIEQLLVVVAALSSDGTGNKDTDVKDRIELLLEQYVCCSAFLLLRMKVVTGDTAELRDYPVRAMMVFVEHFVDSSPFLDRSTLEGWMPYALMHAAYVDMSLGRMRETDSGKKASKKALAAMSEQQVRTVSSSVTSPDVGEGEVKGEQ